MTCKDCIHYAVCEDRERVEKLNQNCNPPPYIRDGNFSPIGCLVFKNKADFVEVVRCKDCKYFKEYSDAHKRAVERADGDCFLKQTHSYDNQFIACRYNDFCSYGERSDT
jgi:hypothetical protein